MASRFQTGAPAEKSRKPLIAAASIGTILLGVLIWFNLSYNSTSETPTSIEAIPGVPKGSLEGTLVSSAGKERTLESLRNKVVIVTFWSPDCESCLANLRDLKGVFSQFSDRGLEIIPVLVSKQNIPEKSDTTGSTADSANSTTTSAKNETAESTEDSALVEAASIEELWEQLGMPYPYYKDPNQRLAQMLKVETFPTTAVLNKAGEVVMIGAGLSGWAESESAESIEKLLTE